MLSSSSKWNTGSCERRVPTAPHHPPWLPQTLWLSPVPWSSASHPLCDPKPRCGELQAVAGGRPGLMGAEAPQRGTAPLCTPSLDTWALPDLCPQLWPANPQQSLRASRMGSSIPTPRPPSPGAQHSSGWPSRVGGSPSGSRGWGDPWPGRLSPYLSWGVRCRPRPHGHLQGRGGDHEVGAAAP